MKDKNKFMADMIEKINRLWNNGEISITGDIITSDFVRYEPGSDPVVGPQGLSKDIIDLRQRFPDLVITFEENIFDGNTMVVHWRFRGTNLGQDRETGMEATGKKVDYKGVDVLHIKDGKISKDYAYFDQVTLLQQLGLMPEMG